MGAGRAALACGLATITFATASACSRPTTEALHDAGQNGTSPGLTGVWKSDGYGLVFAGTGDTIQSYEVTQTTCVPTPKTLIRREETMPRAEAVYSDGYQVFLLRT